MSGSPIAGTAITGGKQNNNGNSTCDSGKLKEMLNQSLSIAPRNSLVSDDRQTPTISGLVSTPVGGGGSQPQIQRKYDIVQCILAMQYAFIPQTFITM